MRIDKIFKFFLVLFIPLLLNFGYAQAGIKYSPKDGKIFVKAEGELAKIKPADSKEQYVLKLTDGRIYILTGKFSGNHKKLIGKNVLVEGFLRGRLEIDKELIPSIETQSLKEKK